MIKPGDPERADIQEPKVFLPIAFNYLIAGPNGPGIGVGGVERWEIRISKIDQCVALDLEEREIVKSCFKEKVIAVCR